MSEYNGWANRDTWNLALWVGNDPGLYAAACDYVEHWPLPTWRGFVEALGLSGHVTGDGVAFDSAAADDDALTEMLLDLFGGIEVEA